MTIQLNELTDERKAEIRQAETAYYSVHTCWWTTNQDDCGKSRPETVDGRGPYTIPIDPAGSPLMMAPAAEFIAAAERHPGHHGKHGIRAFWAAYHGVVTEDGMPRCSSDWHTYNQLIDDQSEVPA